MCGVAGAGGGGVGEGVCGGDKGGGLSLSRCRPFWWASHSRRAGVGGTAARAGGSAVKASRSYCVAQMSGRIATTTSDSSHVMPALAAPSPHT